MKKGFSKNGYKSNSQDKNNPVNVIPSGRITMQDVPHPVFGIDNMGNQMMMFPGGEYNFPGDYVTEYPIRQTGGEAKPQVHYTDPKKFKAAQELYQDSLNLYNAYQIHNANFNPYPYLQNVINASNKYNGPYKGLTPEQALALGKKQVGNIDHPTDVYKVVKKRGPLPNSGNTSTNKNIYNQYKALPFNRPVVIENDESPAIYHKDIRPVRQEFDGIGHHPVYQEPQVVPVYDEPIEPLKPREVNATTLELPPRNILPINNNSPKLKSGEYIMSDTEEEWFQTPSGTWYSRKKPVPGYIHNIHTGGNRKLQHGGSIFPDEKEMGNLFRKTAQEMAKQFGSIKAPQNVTTDGMVNYKKNMFTNKMAQNAFMAMAMQEANVLKDEFATPRPMMQYGGSSDYNPDFSNAGVYFDAYNTMRNQSSVDFNNFLGASGQLAGSIYMNPGELKLKKVRTRLTDPLVQDQYQDYSKMITPPDQNMDPSLMMQQPMMQYGGAPLYADPQGGIGQAMYSSGFYDTYPQDGSQQWVMYPGTNIPMQTSEGFTQNQFTGRREYAQGPQPFTEEQSRRKSSSTVRRGSENTPGNIREFTHEDVASAQGNSSQQTRGNYSGTPSTTSSVPNRGGIFITQPGAIPGYNLFPINRRWQRNGLIPTGPAIAYNPADTYLDEYTYKGRLFGQGPRKVSMRFSHYGQPGFPQTSQDVISNNPELVQGQAPSIIGQPYIPSAQNTHPVYDPNNDPGYGINQNPSVMNSTHGQMDFIQNLNKQLPFNSETARMLGNIQFAEGGPTEGTGINPYYSQQLQLYNESKKPFGMPVDKVLEGAELEQWFKDVGMEPSQAHQSRNLFVGGYKPVKVLYNTQSNNFHPIYDEPKKEIEMTNTGASASGTSSIPKTQRSGYYKGNLNYAANPNASASFNIPYTSDEERMRIEADFRNIKTDKDYKNSPYYQRYGENAYKTGISYVPEPVATLQFGGTFPSQPSYPGAEPIDVYTYMFEHGGSIHIDPSKKGTFKAQASRMGMSVQEAANKILSAPEGRYSPEMRRKANFAHNFAQYGGDMQPGFPSAGQPWAQTEAVWKRSAAGAGQDWADWGLAGMSMLSSFGEQNERNALEEQMKQRMLGDAVFTPTGVGDASRGTWTVNSGAFRPDQNTPVQFQGWNQGMIGSPMTQYQQGGEYYLSDDEIEEIMRMGGNVEYLD